MANFGHILSAGLTDVGRRRKNNEDSYGTHPAEGVFVVADGMGGGDDGEVASAATVKAVADFASRCSPPGGKAWPADGLADALSAELDGASAWICARAREKKLKTCGSTCVGVIFNPGRPDSPLAFHAGDSRLYQIRGKSIKQITADHSAAAMFGAKSEEDVNPMFRGVITRAVGLAPHVELERTEFRIKEGDRLILCSDGLSKMVPDKDICAMVRSAKSPEDAVKTLVDAANKAGGVDNVTAVAMFVGALPPPLPVTALPPGFVKQPAKQTDDGSQMTAVGSLSGMHDAVTATVGGIGQDTTLSGCDLPESAATVIPAPDAATEISGMPSASVPRKFPVKTAVAAIAAGVAAIAVAAVCLRGCGGAEGGGESSAGKTTPAPEKTDTPDVPAGLEKPVAPETAGKPEGAKPPEKGFVRVRALSAEIQCFIDDKPVASGERIELPAGRHEYRYENTEQFTYNGKTVRRYAASTLKNVNVEGGKEHEIPPNGEWYESKEYNELMNIKREDERAAEDVGRRANEESKKRDELSKSAAEKPRGTAEPGKRGGKKSGKTGRNGGL